MPMRVCGLPRHCFHCQSLTYDAIAMLFLAVAFIAPLLFSLPLQCQSNPTPVIAFLHRAMPLLNFSNPKPNHSKPTPFLANPSHRIAVQVQSMPLPVGSIQFRRYREGMSVSAHFSAVANGLRYLRVGQVFPRSQLLIVPWSTFSISASSACVRPAFSRCCLKSNVVRSPPKAHVYEISS